MNDELLPVMDLNVEDVACDDPSEQTGVLLESKKRKMHDFERDAVKSTNLPVFKYPWERVVPRSFSAMSHRCPSLKPDGRNFVGLELQVDASGHFS
jgi:hypothetical protein